MIGELAAAHERKACEQWVSRRGGFLAARAMYDLLAAKFADETAKLKAAQAELEFLDEDLAAIDAEILRLERAIAEQDARSGRNALTQALEVAAKEAQRAVGAFERRLAAVRALEPLCAMTGFGFEDFIPAIAQLTRPDATR